MQLKRIDPSSLSAKQKEIYNFHKVAGCLADFGFNCIKLSDDWEWADFLAYNKDEDQTLKVQLKSRVTIDQKYRDKELWIAFPIDGIWYLIPHDELVKIADETTPWLSTKSWREDGFYHSGNPSQQMRRRLGLYAIG